MNMEKFKELLFENKEIREIPLIYVFKVVSIVFDIINNGDVFYKEEL